MADRRGRQQKKYAKHLVDRSLTILHKGEMLVQERHINEFERVFILVVIFAVIFQYSILNLREKELVCMHFKCIYKKKDNYFQNRAVRT